MSRERVTVGSAAPDFVLRDQDRREVSLAGFRGQPVVVYFYPKDGTRGCTAQTCEFRDRIEAFNGLGAVVLGISMGTVESHALFARQHRITFRLLADEQGEVRERYGVPKTLGLLPGRSTYVIDSRGIVRHIFSSQMQARRHVEEARAALERLKTERADQP